MDQYTDKTKLSSTGFSVVELLVVITMIGIIVTIALVNFHKTTRSLDLAGSTRALSAYLEKARVDSVRHHGGGSISLNSTSSYTVNIDFDGTGTTTARTITLPAGMSLGYSLLPATAIIAASDTPITIDYDWRGRTGNTILLTLADSTLDGRSNTVAVGPAGDITIDTAVTGPVTTPTPQNNTVTLVTGIKSMR